jgi:heat shock protein beta
MDRYFERVEALLRRSLGVSLTAKADTQVRPAPPTAHGPLSEDGVDGEVSGNDDHVFVNQAQEGMGGEGDEWLDWADLKRKQEIKAEVEHDEL